MKIQKIHYSDNSGKKGDWILNDFSLTDINLIVGQNATGKSRTLNVINGLAKIVSEKKTIQWENGEYDILFYDNITEKKPLLHGPVEAGQCGSCHKPHGAKEPKLLLAQGTDLCLGCHDQDDVYAGAHHDITNRLDCLQCHDAHGSTRSYLLITTLP